MKAGVVMNNLQKKIIDVMSEIHNVCVRNDIKYSLIGGSLIGAVRHKGFIPWDDDIDIAMLRSDYEKFINLPKSEFADFIEVENFHQNPYNIIFYLTK